MEIVMNLSQFYGYEFTLTQFTLHYIRVHDSNLTDRFRR